MAIDSARVADWLGRDQPTERRRQYAGWAARLEAVTPEDVVLPPTADLRRLLERLGFASSDADEVLAHRPDPERDPELWWLLARSRQDLVNGMGDVSAGSWGGPHLPARLGAAGRLFYVHLLLAAIDEVLAYHKRLGIEPDISWATLADLGRQVAIHRRINGTAGLDVQFWFSLHFRGLIYDFGRLQFNRAMAQNGTNRPYAEGEPLLGTHIPETGPLRPGDCDEAFARARDFYARHFPETPYRYATCASWLLDDQLAEYLPAESNIVAFQRRFQLYDEATPLPMDAERTANGWAGGDPDVLQFVLRMKDPRPEDLPQETTLQRAIVAHREAGRHWRVRRGWLEL